MKNIEINSKITIKYIFIDTNVLYHCKFFTEIDCFSIFPDKPDKIHLIVPNKVIEEIDEGKYNRDKKLRKRARKVISKFNELVINPEFNKGIELNLSILPPKWEKLEQKWKDALDKSIDDHHIIAEILNFSGVHNNDDIIFISADFIPLQIAKKIGISTINWRNEEYSDTFIKPKEKKEKYPVLEICFNHETKQKEIILSKEIPKPELMKFIQREELLKEIPEEIKKMAIKELRNLEDYEKYLEILSPNVKSDEEFKKEIDKYNKNIKEYVRYKEIPLFLSNNGDITYHDIDIRIKTTLENDFKIDYKDNLKKPEKPKRHNHLTIYGGHGVPYYNDEWTGNVICHHIEDILSETNKIWNFGYNISKFKHGEYTILYPIAIRIPEKFNSQMIILKCHFTQEEKGKIKAQNLRIILK